MITNRQLPWEKLTRTEESPKYTKDPNKNEKFRGWSRKGIKRYNDLIKVVRRNRNSIQSKEMDNELKTSYAKICGKIGERNGGGVSSDSDDSDDESLEAYNGFAGDSTIISTPFVPV